MNKQLLFDKAVLGLLEQKQKSLNFINCCCYRNSGGLKCAFGFLIPDDKYKKLMESQHIDLLIKEQWFIELYGNINNDTRNMLHRLQKIHDSRYPTEWYIALKLLAQEYNLFWRFSHYEPQ